MTWFNPNHSTGNCLVRKMTKGKRLVLLHAMTQYGMVQLDPLYSGSADDRILSAELIYEANKDKGDYHDNMDGHIYVVVNQQTVTNLRRHVSSQTHHSRS